MGVRQPVESIREISLLKTKRNDWAKLHGCQRAPWVSLLPFAQTAEPQGASSDDSICAEHKNDSDPTGSPGKTEGGKSPHFFLLNYFRKTKKP